MRCLVVDDSETFLASAARLLESQGVQVVGCASSTRDAMRMTADSAPDVALVDVELGAEDGLELARALLAAPQPTPVILISAYGFEDLPDLLGETRIRFLPKTSLGASAIRVALGSAGS